MAPIRLLIADDHPVVRDGVALLLRGEPALVVVGAAESGRAALERASELKPDLVLLDLRLPDMLAPEVVVGLRELVPAARVVVFTAHGDHHAHAHHPALQHLLQGDGVLEVGERVARAVGVGEHEHRVTPCEREHPRRPALPIDLLGQQIELGAA